MKKSKKRSRFGYILKFKGFWSKKYYHYLYFGERTAKQIVEQWPTAKLIKVRITEV